MADKVAAIDEEELRYIKSGAQYHFIHAKWIGSITGFYALQLR
jgi:hypothetical protein